MFHITTTFIIISSCIYETLSCGGYDIDVKKIKNCGKENVIQVKDKISIHLDKKCNVIPKGCVQVKKDFQTFNASISASQDGIELYDDTFDGCKLLKKQGINSCPIKAGEICIKGEFTYNIKEYKDFLAIFSGKFNLNMKVKHDSGKSCFKLEGNLYKKKNKKN